MNKWCIKVVTRAGLWDVDEAVGLLQVLAIRLVAELCSSSNSQVLANQPCVKPVQLY